MGNNVPALILTDFVDSLAREPRLGEKIKSAVNLAHRPLNDDLPTGIRILPYHHADSTRIIAVGNNSLTHLGWCFVNFPHGGTDEARIKAAIASLESELLNIRRKRNSAA